MNNTSRKPGYRSSLLLRETRQMSSNCRARMTRPTRRSRVSMATTLSDTLSPDVDRSDPAVVVVARVAVLTTLAVLEKVLRCRSMRLATWSTVDDMWYAHDASYRGSSSRQSKSLSVYSILLIRFFGSLDTQIFSV